MTALSESQTRPMYVYLMVLSFAQAASFLGWNTLYTNFAVEVVGLTGEQNGIVQSVRELPGLLSVMVLFFLLFVSEVRLTSLATLVCGAGVMLTGLFPTFQGQVFWTFVLSTGFHVFETTNQSLILQYFSKMQAPLVIGRLRALTSAGSFFMGAAILIFSRYLDFNHLFFLAGAIAILAGLWGLFQHPEVKGLPVQRKGIVLRREYWLFYALTCLAGARRQIFMVFAAFLLVQKFQFSLFHMSLLFLCNNLITWVLNPYIGKAINAYGERSLLSVKYLMVLGVCVAYVFCSNPYLAAGLYVIDQILFSFTVSIRTFFQKIGDPEDIAPSMAVGVTVNHIAAVFVPLVGGMLWMIDYRIPFMLGTVFAIVSLCLVQCIRTRKSAA